MKLHEIQQALEVLGVWKAIRRATGGGGSTIVQGNVGGGVWGTITGNISNQTDLQTTLDTNEDFSKRYTFLMS